MNPIRLRIAPHHAVPRLSRSRWRLGAAIASMVLALLAGGYLLLILVAREL